MMRLLLFFGLNDLKNIWRDSLLLGVLIIPWVLVLSVRLLIPELTAWLLQRYQFDLVAYYPLLLSIFFFLNIPILLGALMGFLILDERDDKTLMALQVTPISVTGMTLYRIASTSLLSSFYILICTPLTGLMPMTQTLAIVAPALLSGLLAPFIGLLLPAFASNKVEGLAIAKGLGILLVGPLGAYFINPPLQYLFGLLPSYWIAKAFWLGLSDQSYGLFVLVGGIYQGLVLWGLFARFQSSVSYST
ncbi:MAG: hypothetical protein HC921_11285 [Synechococcaceae cyanobacterium SM2_3_1]|nr:hypothetical protein [Synechococcaceae cyanobacterium SM2_3_1]